MSEIFHLSSVTGLIPMLCLHPYCPASSKGSISWTDVVDHPDLKVRSKERAGLVSALNLGFSSGPVDPPIARSSPTANTGLLTRLLKLCPCLFNQIDVPPTAQAVVHFCELTLGAKIDSANVHEAFLVQHPRRPSFQLRPLQTCKEGGGVMEFLCSEALTSAGIPAMELSKEKWPVWKMPGHILMNRGAMSALKAFGDILIPCAPTNLAISIKSEAARERLLYSANSIEGIGFGFFAHSKEFWTVSRMSLYKRMGFSAIYMPKSTHEDVMRHLHEEGTKSHAVNVNGRELYRPLEQFGNDMLRVVGRSSTLL